jgi:hypothetical protein
VTFVCQLTTKFLSEAAQNDGGGGQWGKQNKAAQDAGLKPQVTFFHLPLRPGRRRWLARSRKYEVRTCLAAGVIAPNSCCAPPTQTHTLPGLKHLVIPEPMAVRGWVVAKLAPQSIEPALPARHRNRHMPLISPVAVRLRSTHPTSTTGIPLVALRAEAGVILSSSGHAPSRSFIV